MNAPEDVAAATDTERAAEALRSLVHNNAEVRKGAGERLLELAEGRCRRLDARERNKQTKNLICALEDAEDANVTHDALETSVLHKAHSSKNLNCLVGDKPSALRGIDLADGGLNLIVVRPAIHIGAQRVSNALRGVCTQGHFGKLLADEAVLADLVPKLHAPVGVVGGLGDQRLHRSGERSAHPKASVVQNVHGNLEAAADIANDILDGDLDVLKVDLGRIGALNAHLLFGCTVCNTAKRSLDDEGSDLVALLARLGINNLRLRKHGEDLGDATVGDPNLAAVEHKVLAIGAQNGARADRVCIGSTAGLSERKSGKLLSTGKLGKILLLLGVVACNEDTLESDRLMRAQCDANSEIVCANDLHETSISGVGEAKTTEVLGHLQAKRAHFAQSLQRSLGDLCILVVKSRVIHLPEELATGLDKHLELLRGLLGKDICGREWKHLFLPQLAEKETTRKGRLARWSAVAGGSRRIVALRRRTDNADAVGGNATASNAGDTLAKHFLCLVLVTQGGQGDVDPHVLCVDT
eukprot:Opistho-2@91182